MNPVTRPAGTLSRSEREREGVRVHGKGVRRLRTFAVVPKTPFHRRSDPTLVNITLITATFPPEPIVAGRMVRDLAVHLSSLGHQVRVICPFPSRGTTPARPVSSAGNRLMVRPEDGLEIVRVPSFSAPRSSWLGRARESWSFGSWAARALASQPFRPAIVYEVAWPLVAQAAIRRACEALGIPRVTHIMDLYPESALAKLPKWFGRRFGPPLIALDRHNARSATRALVVSEPMRQIYERTRAVPVPRLAVVPTWQDETDFLQLPDRSIAARHYGADPSQFTFLYLGNIGPVAGVEHLIHAFTQAQLADSHLLLVGEGTRKPACLALAAQSRANIRFLSEPDTRNVPLVQSLANVCLLPLRRGSSLSSVPSKLSAYMLSAKPILAPMDSEADAARLIASLDCGRVVEPEDTAVLARMMSELRHWPQRDLLAAGQRGRAFALKHLSRGPGVKNLAAILLAAAKPNSNSHGA